MKKLLYLLFLSLTLAGHTQVVSRFTFDSTPLTKASIGPNGTSVNSTAYPVAVAAPVNYAINPGTPTKDIDLVVPGSPTFDIPGIDIDVYFRREESEASFFKRGSVFNFGMNGGQLYVTFATNKGSNPGTITVNSGNAAAVPDDHAFHHYRFIYDNNSGTGKIYLDGTVVYTYNGTAGYTMNWSGAGDVVIGSKMDATGRNIAVLGDITVKNPALAASLPVSLLSFSASVKNNAAVLDWTTTKELNVSKFIIEASADGTFFLTVTTITSAGSYDLVRHYQATDNTHHNAVVLYRLKMVDNDGKFSYSEIKKVSFGSSSAVGCYPNPANDYVMLSLTNEKAGNFKYVVLSLNGNIVETNAVYLQNGAQQIKINLGRNIPAGVLLVQLVNVNENKVDSFRIIKG